VINYQINKEIIAKTYCVNKAKPNLHCNGKCHLAKQLKKQDKSQNQSNSTIKSKVELQLFVETKSNTRMVFSIEKCGFAKSTNDADYSKHLFAVFRPPCIA
jgi:hypothetical protein